MGCKNVTSLPDSRCAEWRQPDVGAGRNIKSAAAAGLQTFGAMRHGASLVFDSADAGGCRTVADILIKRKE
jgi:hypothetical protein